MPRKSQQARVIPNPIFICGCHRSGTTLVESILNRHDQLQILPETKLGAWFWSPWNRNLRRRPPEAIVEELCDKMGQINRVWRNPPYANLVAHCRKSASHSLPSVFETVPQLVEWFLSECRESRELRIGEKTPLHIYHAQSFLEYFPEAQVIVVERDLRGAYCSQSGRQKAGLSRRRFQHLRFVSAWRNARALAEHYHSIYGDKRVYRLSFEELVSDPDAQLTRLFEFLGVEFQSEVLEVKQSNSSFSPPTIGINADAGTRWKDQLAPELAADLHELAGISSRRSPRILFQKMPLSLVDALVRKCPAFICYLARDQRYRLPNPNWP